MPTRTTVCILAAGAGTRSRASAMGMHKALLPVGNRAVLSHIIGQFPPDSRFVLALGHYADQVRDYLAAAHPDIDAVCVPVDRVTGAGAGPGYSLLACRPHLQEPFVFTACDTLVPAEIPATDRNWLGVQPVDRPERWCTVATAGDRVTGLFYKRAGTPPLGFIGIAGVNDHDRFWTALERGLATRAESQVVPGLEALIEPGLAAVELPWHDTGDEEGYAALLGRFDPNYSFEGKTTDATYRLDDRIIKFFADPAVSARRFERGRRHPEAFAPVLEHRGHCYSYRFVEGENLAGRLDPGRMTALLDWLETAFWRRHPCDPGDFAALCRRFYRDKTLDRLGSYLARFGDGAEPEILRIDGLSCPPVAVLVEDLPEAFWSGGLPSTFHGDLHADNVLVDGDGRFTLIDWRQDFGGLTAYGDRYYDLAKFFHTLDFSVTAMRDGFRIREAGGEVALAHDPLPEADALQAAFWAFCARHGYDRHRIQVLNALIFVNMAPLYDRRLADYLYLLGRRRLAEALAGPDSEH
ncbi:NTP transferase domain-containing protein [Thalassobaculum sp.]|uniref:NTP transferase domain-containing protein n=1 Tax=Thalassobaculum sp. TaxID=2022740 RepID=UPI0032EB7E3D